MVEKAFAPIPVRERAVFDREMVGRGPAARAGPALYGREDPTAHFYRGRPYSVRRDDGGSSLASSCRSRPRTRSALSRHARRAPHRPRDLAAHAGPAARILSTRRRAGARFDDGTQDPLWPPGTLKEQPRMTDQPPTDALPSSRRASASSSAESGAPRWTRDAPGIETAFWAMVHTLFPEEARKHLKVAGREQLLAARVYLTAGSRGSTKKRRPRRRAGRTRRSRSSRPPSIDGSGIMSARQMVVGARVQPR